MPVPGEDEELSWHERALRLVAVALPFGLALMRAAGSGQWRDDLPALRDLGLVAVGIGGGASTLLSQALSILPLGARTFRAASGSVLALGAAAWILFMLSRRMLRALGAGRALAALLAALGALSAGLSPTWQREATVGGGAMLATALALATVTAALDFVRPGRAAPARAWILGAALLGATFAESPPAGLAALVGAAGAYVADRWQIDRKGLRWKPRGAPVSPRLLAASAATALVIALLLLVPLLVRPLAPRAFADVGRALSAADLTGFDVAGPRLTTLAAWGREVGYVAMLIALAGGVLAVRRAEVRALIVPLLAFVLLDTLMPARAFGVLYVDPLTALRALAVAALCACSSLGVCFAVQALLLGKLPFARSGAVLIVVFHVTLLALSSEEAGYVADRGKQVAAEEWTDGALGRLEPDAAILVRSPAMAFRLWAARLLRGERPDVVIVPVHLLHRGRVALSLLSTERELSPLLRDFALTGEPSEYALSKLADVRPLHIELDRGWSKRLVGHLLVDGLWLEYAPQPLGPSDRKQSTATSLVPIRRVMAAIAAPIVPDGATATVVAGTMRDESAVLSMLGEHDAAQAFLDEVAKLAPSDAFSSGMSIKHAAMAKAMAVVNGVRTRRVAARNDPGAGR
jgi:hypothetical protein